MSKLCTAKKNQKNILKKSIFLNQKLPPKRVKYDELQKTQRAIYIIFSMNIRAQYRKRKKKFYDDLQHI
ncbi:TPA: hypothetical protein DIC40_01320 [Patescibacteria group bacterium]|nr:hypothetical protein [Candidatus Gracilibacteria bacterium]